MTLVCKKSLRKSTYRGNAFVKGRSYEVIREDDYVWLRDEHEQEFNFARQADYISYLLSDYFEDP